MNWKPPERPTDFAERHLIEAILQGVYPIDSTLPSERELCEILGVTRPTLREVLQRMRRDGWVEVHQGKPTRVQNYLEEGNLNVLNAIANANVPVSVHVVESLLQVRLLLAPTYFSLASQLQAGRLTALLHTLIPISQNAFEAGKLDWELHITAAQLSNNPVFSLILNGFDQVYLQMAEPYFEQAAARQASEDFYRDILNFTTENSPQAVFTRTQQMMKDSITYWKQSLSQEDKK